jgi:iron complex transport system permease protein
VRKALSYVLLLATLVAAMVVSLLVGPAHVPADEVVAILFGKIADRPAWGYIVEDRLSRTLVALAAGAGLSLAGLVMQTIFRNPLAGPGILGVSAGAGAGSALAILLPAGVLGVLGGQWTVILFSGIGAFAALGLILWVSRFFTTMSGVLITGLMLTFFLSAIVSILLQYGKEGAVQRYVMWGMGSTAGIDIAYGWGLLVLVLLSGAFLWAYAHRLNLLMVGDVQARLSGMNVVTTRIVLLVVVGLITAVVTAFCGPVGFVGMAVPHLARAAGTRGLHRHWVVYSAIIGAALLVLCDVLTRVPVPLPLNAVTSILGAPVVVWVLLKGKRKGGLE